MVKILAVFLIIAAIGSSPKAEQGRASTGPSEPGVPGDVTELLPTSHPPMPRDLSLVWLAPQRGFAVGSAAATGALANVVKLVSGGDYAKAVSVASQPSLQRGALGLYAAYYGGMAQLRLNRAADALRTFRSLRGQKPIGYLVEAAALGEAEADIALNDPRAAVSIYERLAESSPSSIEDVLLRLGRAAKAAGDLSKASDAFGRLYYEFALSDLAVNAGTELAMLNLHPVEPDSPRFALELGRAERLFLARQYGAARSAFDGLRPLASGDAGELVQLRLAECDYFLKRFRAARDGVKPIVERQMSRKGEALYFYAVASRDVGDLSTYFVTIPRIVDDFPTERWAEEALNSFASYSLLGDDYERTDRAFRDLYEKYPKGAYAERAAWKAGWFAYRKGRYKDTVRFFERAASDFPRSDYRPSWLYWSGRARERLGDQAAANQRYAIAVVDYLNSYYGRLAADRLGHAATEAAQARHMAAAAGPQDVALTTPLPPNAPIIRALLGEQMFDDAVNELRYARMVWGDSPALQATVAWANQQQSRTESGMKRFQLVRGAITTMRRAYPQFLTAGGEELPRDVLTVIYPIAYWDLIRRYAAQNQLDPYLMAALVSQESTFVADIRSPANAVGLMQLMPATAREYARKLKMPYSPRLLTDPEANIRMGTAFFADKLREFGDWHLVLASYNAGATPVRRWVSQRAGLEQEEFIDDIPYPETQGYVKKILGTAEDYRRLYGAGEADLESVDKTPVAAASADDSTRAPAPAVKPPSVTPKARPKTTPAARKQTPPPRKS